ncbi:MAG: FkbM family methyltransferase [Smithella sp.]
MNINEIMSACFRNTVKKNTKLQVLLSQKKTQQKFVLYGAGRLGRHASKGLRNSGCRIKAFIDSDVRKQGTYVDGIRVYGLDEYAKLPNILDDIIIITIWNPSDKESPIGKIVETLNTAGFSNIITWPDVFRVYSEQLLPWYSIGKCHNILNHNDEINEALSLMADEASRDCFLKHLTWIITGDVSKANKPTGDEQYFLKEIFSGETVPSIFVDCGAYDGDTIERYLAWCNNNFSRIVAFEPDPVNYQKLEKFIFNLPENVHSKISLEPCGVGAVSGETLFLEESGTGSGLGKNGTVPIGIKSLDEVLPPKQQSCFIKMDIEGAELDALQGAKRLIKTSRPILAICLYHKQNHLWDIPLLVDSLADKYQLYLRAYAYDGFELVLYAIPAEKGIVLT